MMKQSLIHSWRVEIPSRCCSTETVRQPAEIVDNCGIYVRVTPTVFIGSNVRISLSVHKTDPNPIKVDITLRLGSIREEKKLEYEWRDSCSFPEFCLISPCSVVNIVCEIIWPFPEAITPPKTLDFPKENFLMSSSFSDVTIVIGGEELPAHKLILAGHSPVFFQMLSTPMKETQTNRIDIKDVDSETMKTVLTLLYTGKYEALLDVPVACKVLAAAHKYNMERVMEACVYTLYKKLDVQHVLRILQTADLYEAEKLKQECWKFVMRKKKEIISTVEFQDFCVANRALMNQFMTAIIQAYP